MRKTLFNSLRQHSVNHCRRCKQISHLWKGGETTHVIVIEMHLKINDSSKVLLCFSLSGSIESTIISVRGSKKVVLVWSRQEYGDDRTAQWQLRSNSLLAEWMCCWRRPKRNYLWIPKVCDNILQYNRHMRFYDAHTLSCESTAL